MIDLRRLSSYDGIREEYIAMTREQLRQQGEATRTRLFGSTTHEPAGFGTLLTEAALGAVWNRPGLALADRMLCTLAALAVWPRLRQLRRHIGAALDLGLSPEAIREVLVQAGLYAGFSAAEETLALAGEVFAERGVPFPPDPPADAPLEELASRGRVLMQDVHGERSRQGYAAPENPVTFALYELAIQYGYGEIWFRPGLDRRARALVAIAAFTALRLPEQAKRFGQAALNLGASRTEVIEAVIQTAPHSGFPPALNVLSALSDALR
jgi:alkylhydroperoxidase/carboxymuconolactone decarboxylase family protein YurZ